ncbi:MAG: hypothetical protein AB1757_12750 [Acidobacteriota bacterium]
MNSEGSITSNERALVVVSNLVTHGRSDLRWLYQFIEHSGVKLTDMILGSRYRHFHKLVGEPATLTNFLTTLAALTNEDSLQAIDVILHLHGDEKVLFFEDGEYSTESIKQELLELNHRHKLRMLYSTGCYGKHHAVDLVAGGFKVACGAIATNANAATEYPTFLTLWAAGSKFKEAIAAGDIALTRIPQDRAAKAMGFADADSTKTIIGDGNLTIKSGV